MRVGSRELDGFLAQLAGRQHGVVTRSQLLSAGFGRGVVQRRVASGALIPLVPGVYLVGHRAVSPLAHEAAAILSCQPDAFLSHHTAARLYGPPAPATTAVHVTVLGRTRRPPRGVIAHSIGHLDLAGERRHEGLPLLSPSLTVLDLAGAVSPQELARALNEARVLRLVSDHELGTTLARHPRRTGARALRELLDGEAGPRITRSEAERRALQVMKSHGIEPDETQHQIGPYRVDFWFERERVAVEVDGFRYHATPKRFVEDRRRTAYLAARGVLTYPLTWPDLTNPLGSMGRLRETLAMRRTP